MTVQETAALLRGKDQILILTHRRPDGDTIGCAAGLCAALRRLGKTAYVLQNPEVTDINRVYVEPYWAPADFTPDFVVSVDIAARQLFYPAAEQYLSRVDFRTICRELGEITPEIALPLYAAVATDTGCFVYANTTANTHAVAAALLETGIDYFAVNKRHFRTKSRRRLALEADMLANMEFFDEGRGVFMAVPLSLMESLQATENDAEDLSTLAGIIEGVDCGAVLRELPDGSWKLSLRTGANGRVNATKVCKLLGGGGHAMAAGATVSGTLPEVKEQIRAAVAAVLAEAAE